MKKEPKQEMPQRPKRVSNLPSEERMENIKAAAVRLYEEILLLMKAFELSPAEGFTALTDALWWLCKNFDELPPRDENDPRTFDLFMQALKVIDNERTKSKEASKEDREGTEG